MIRLILRFLLAAGLAGALAACGMPAAWAPVIAAGLGFGTAVVTLEERILAARDEETPPPELEFSPGP